MPKTIPYLGTDCAKCGGAVESGSVVCKDCLSTLARDD
jgi:hypothetical protein